MIADALQIENKRVIGVYLRLSAANMAFFSLLGRCARGA